MNFWEALTPDDLLRVFVGLIFVAFVVHGVLLARLRTTHNATWVSLGKPTLFGSGQGSPGLLQFTGVRGAFRELNDPVFNSLVYAQRLVIIVMIVAFMAAILIGLYPHTNPSS